MVREDAAGDYGAGEIDGRLFPVVLLLWRGAILYARETERV
jgi:hypothetical protein